MISEDIFLISTQDGLWNVRARYLFHNTTDKTLQLTMGFPELQGDDGDEFLQFETKVRGKRIKVRKDTSAPFTPDLDKGEGLGQVHLFDVTFKPNETLSVEHSYRMRGDSSVAIASEKQIRFITRTGALWAGPIGRARFTIRVLGVYELIAWPPSFDFKSLRRFVVKKGAQTGMQLVLENRDWVPSEDLQVDFLFDVYFDLRNHLIGGECPGIERDDQTMEYKANNKKSTKYKVIGLDDYDSNRLRLCRNYVYARYGFGFSDRKLTNRFYGEVHEGQYPPNVKGMREIDSRQVRNIAPLMPDAAFDSAMLTPEDLFYVKTLRDEERRRKRLQSYP